MSKIPTAEEFLTISDEFEVLETRKQEEVVTKTMIEFAKLHVEACKKEYLQHGFGRYFEHAFEKYPTRVPIDEDSILNAYPLDLIK